MTKQYLRVHIEFSVNNSIIDLCQCITALKAEWCDNLPNRLLNTALAEAVTTACLYGIPQSHEADRTLVFAL